MRWIAFAIGSSLAVFAISPVDAESLAPASSGTALASHGPIDTLQAIAPAIAACWRPPHEGDTITLRLSFRRDGSLIGRPRITYSRASGGPNGAADLATSMFAALTDCTPLQISPQLAGAIAGRVFLIRFVAPRREQKV